MEKVFSRSGSSGSSRRSFKNEEAGTILESLPNDTGFCDQVVDVHKLTDAERRGFTGRAFKVAVEDDGLFLERIRQRCDITDKIGLSLPTVEVRFEHLTVEAKCHVGRRALPTLIHATQNIIESTLEMVGIRLEKRTQIHILKDASGVIKPSRMTLLLGPPSSGKTTLLLALAGRLDPTLKAGGMVTYNGYKLDEFVVQKTAAYISQNNIHTPELTVRETIDFAARCHGVGARCELLSELLKREKDAGISPNAEVDFFMKATATGGVRNNLQTDYILRILGLDDCADTIIGDVIMRGISGGQKKRLTTGEMIVGPMKIYFMDEISVGLDSSTIYQIIKCLQQIVHLGEATILMSLLQPSPEIFDLFDDIILINEGHILYHGPRESVLHFFESCGFQCPERKGIADFIQEVISRNDQKQYWADHSRPYSYVSAQKFSDHFNNFHIGLKLKHELSIPFDKSSSHFASLVFEKHTVPYSELLSASFTKEWLLIKRNLFMHIIKFIQIVVVAFIASTVFLRTRIHPNTISDGNLYIGSLEFALVMNLFSGFLQLVLTASRLPVFYKHRDLLLYPAWVFTLPNFVLRIPISMLESFVWVATTYYTIGFAPEASRFFKQFLLLFLIQQVAAGLFRLIAAVCKSILISNTGGSLCVIIICVLSGFMLPKGAIPTWWTWGYWISPLTYGFDALTINEFLAPRWMTKFADDGKSLGVAVLESANVIPKEKWYWIGVVIYLGYIITLNILFTLALASLTSFGKSRAIITEEIALELHEKKKKKQELSNSKVLDSHIFPSNEAVHSKVENDNISGLSLKKGMVLPFTPLSISFYEVNYYVDMPKEFKNNGVNKDRLQLLAGVTGAFRPKILTALMGISGAGKTTLLDVLAGRKTRGYIEGDIRISGYHKMQATFTRISGYCEQNDIHSPQVTVRESLIYSAFLRLPKEVSDEEKMEFVDEVLGLMELNNLKDAIVGLPDVTGLSTEQRKRLTIAVELVANPSIIFMDEPTSGLDARAAAIVMRIVRNTVDTGRTVVCTIHQPSTEIFEAFDELLLLKRGGQVIFYGPLGQKARDMIDYFEAIPGVAKIENNYNPATWMLEVSSVAAEIDLGIDLANYYKASILYEQNKAIVNELSKRSPGSRDINFSTLYSQSMYAQFKCCLWKQWWTYWRTPDYNLVRLLFTVITSFLLGSIFWNAGDKREDANDIKTVVGSMSVAVMFVGITNCSTAQSVIAIERTVFYRERAAGIYSAFPYALAQVIIEIPYVFTQALIYIIIIYPMMGFQWTIEKFMWFYYITFFSFLYFTYFGMMSISFSPNEQVASMFASNFYPIFHLFSGFFIPKPKIPKLWIWYYWICPLAWTLYGLITTQYGDLDDIIEVPGQTKQPIKTYVKEYFGYHRDFMNVVALVLLLFAFVFAFTFAFCIKTLNFQKR